MNKNDEFKTVVLGQVGVSQMDVSIDPAKFILLREHFIDPNDTGTDECVPRRIYTVQMNIRPNYIPNLLRVLLDAGFKPEKK